MKNLIFLILMLFSTVSWGIGGKIVIKTAKTSTSNVSKKTIPTISKTKVWVLNGDQITKQVSLSTKGKVKIKNLDSGTYTIVISHPNMKTNYMEKREVKRKYQVLWDPEKIEGILLIRK